jgi:DNA-directed RNA polymerase subunit RPC12/RpoP
MSRSRTSKTNKRYHGELYRIRSAKQSRSKVRRVMGKPEKLITAECFNCKDIVIPIDEDVKDDGKKVYSCPSCGSTFHIEFTIEYEEEEPKNDTKH